MARRNTSTAAKAKSGKVSVDFTGVETRILLPEGVYNAVVEEVTMEEGEKANYLKWKFKTVDDDPKLNDKPLYNNTSLAAQSLWVLASLLDTLGVERPEGAMDIDLTELPGLEIGLVVEHEEYNGKMQSKVVDFTPANGEEGGDDEVVVEGGEDGDTYTTDEINEADAETLDAVVEASGIEVKKSKKIAMYRAAVLAALEEAGLIDDEAAGGEEGDITEDDILAMDKDELDAFVEENGLKVKKSPKLPIYAAAVAAAAEEAGLLGDAEGDGEEGEGEGEGEEEGVTEDDINAMDKDELGAFVTENGLKVKALPKIAAYRAAVVAAATTAGLIAEEGNDDLYSADDINAMDQAELAALVKENGLKVAFTKLLKKNRSLVIDALEAAELMKDE